MSNPVPEGWSIREAESLYKRLRVPRVYDRNQVSQYGVYPVIDQSESGCIGYLNSTPEFECSPESPMTTFANHTCAVRQMTKPFGVIQNVFPLEAKEDVSQGFLFQILRDAIRQDGYKGHYPQLRETQFLTPPLPEQQKISAILSTVDDVIEKTRAQIDKLKDLKTGMMQELLTKGIGHTEFKDSPVGRIPVGWDVVELNSLVQKIHSGWSPVCEPRPRCGSEWGILKTTAVVWSGYDPSENKVLAEGLATVDNAIVVSGDVLITRKGPRERVGVCVYVSETPDRLMVPDTVFRVVLKSNDAFLGEYVSLALSSDYVQLDWNRKKVGLAEAQVNLNHQVLNATRIALPSAEEQGRICKMLSAMQSKIDSKQRFAQGYSKIKKALMQDLLTGKVRVKVDKKESAVA